jgi:hypothetical protein
MAGKEVAENIVSDPPRGRPFGGGGVHPTGLRGFLSIMENSIILPLIAWIIIDAIPSKP